MSKTLLIRASLLTPLDTNRWQYISDGGLLIKAGRIVDVDRIEQFADGRDRNTLELDGLLVPGFADVHIHWVQHHVRGRFQTDLMEWLREHIWPEEAGFEHAGLAHGHARAFFSDTLRAGTTLGMAYSSPHDGALRIAAGHARGDWILGNAIMEKSAPEPLRRASPDNAEAVAPLLEELGTAHYAITPRFALNCSARLMKELGELAQRTGAFVQTHLSESPQEIREVREAFPEALDYTDVYDRAGLLTPRTVLGHCIHLSQREYHTLAQRHSWIAHCPSSNEALDSGRMDLEAVRRHRLRFALASDVGAGPSHSMLHVMQRFVDQHRAAGVPVTPEEALYRATQAGADCLGRGGEAGSLTAGKRADFVLLPRPAGKAGIEDWFEELLRGDAADLERRPLQTWLGGTPVSPDPVT
ncbi:amidohydrolase family protein [Alloalcanivorax xenomutans]|uniref:Amidohydrolase family protein n=1 Tax=Alloalcanivorax xenomutans TaxID=1094342 RepID=A0A9Q3W443_9GAMM|nr:amidohydrolase family protein [Alloalcanivorax xenomutans]ARB47230.1 guanine deaminase [Alloalcanivorax xenomutans]MCE7508236.1 amidohydrolase family protein [Alloalcanivorax xenomutans]